MYSNRELQTFSPNMRHFLRKIQRVVHTIVPDSQVILYGSRARGDAGRFSDWDILILVDGLVDSKLVQHVRDALYDLELESGRIISSILRTSQEWNSPKYAVMPFKNQVEHEGIIL